MTINKYLQQISPEDLAYVKAVSSREPAFPGPSQLHAGI